MSLALLLVAVLLLAVAPISAQDDMQTPVIIDTDMGSDDWMAILFMLQRDDIDVQAIAVNGTGLAYCDAGVHIALGLLTLMEYGDIPVTCGSETPLAGTNAFPDAWRTNMEGAESMGLPESAAMPAAMDSVELLTSMIADAAEPITILALGPLTNVGAALDATPELADNIAMIYIMGGAVDVDGSFITDDNTTAEWNIYCDPYSAHLTFVSGAPVTLVPLDATNHVPVSAEFYEMLDANHTTPAADFIHAMLTGDSGFEESDGFFFWDPLAAAAVVDAGGLTIETRSVTVVDVEGPENGRTKPVANGSEIQVAVNADSAAFYEGFLATINAE